MANRRKTQARLPLACEARRRGSGRSTRLTNGFSKKLENFKAAVGLHLAHYNFVRLHKSLRTTLPWRREFLIRSGRLRNWSSRPASRRLQVGFLANPYVLGAAVAWLLVFAAAAIYINRAAALSQFIDNGFPDLWPKLSWARDERMKAYAIGLPAKRTENLVFFNVAAKDHPDDPRFRRLLRETRYSAGVFLLAMAVACALSAQADVTTHLGV